MASADDVRKLAALARISLSEEESLRLAGEFDSILGYVGQIESLDLPDAAPIPGHRNVFREDGEPHGKGVHTEKVAGQFPERSGNSLSVKQIISHD